MILDENYLTPEDEANFMQLAENVANQVQTWQENIFLSLVQENVVIENMVWPGE